MRENRKILIIAGSSAILAGLLLFAMFHFVPSPPLYEMTGARKSLSAALSARADSYSSDEFRDALALYDSAMTAWKKENQRFIYSRDYKKVIEFAGESALKAVRSSEKAKLRSDSLRNEADLKIKTLNGLVADLAERFYDYPLSVEVRHSISKGKFLIAESRVAFENHDYLIADNKLTESESLLASSYELANEHLKSYFRSYPQWRRWADTTISRSKTSEDYSIIVDKFSRRFLIYQNGKVHSEYSTELGRNWVGDKRVRGDKATPEGMYKIIKMFKSDSTKYYKALLLDYPNEEDTINFIAAKAKGYLPQSAKIGGMIEIHGNGGRGADWTEGCIALTDREMDSIFKIVKIGTPVTIVGSLYSLRHFLKE